MNAINKLALVNASAPIISIEKQKANERYFINIIKTYKNIFMWKDEGEVYVIINNQRMKPTTMKGWHKLSLITSKQFMLIFVDIPDVINF
tara:strand:+ start:228 stop:497 length:270 start_codon:yes stop_codon:yes gene_type:complete